MDENPKPHETMALLEKLAVDEAEIDADLTRQLKYASEQLRYVLIQLVQSKIRQEIILREAIKTCSIKS